MFFRIGLRQDTSEVGQVRKLLCSLWWDIGVGILSACPQAHLALPWLGYEVSLFTHYDGSYLEAAVEGTQGPEARNQRNWEGRLEGPESPCELTVRSAVVSGMELGRQRREEGFYSFKSSQYQEAGLKVGTEDTEKPFCSMEWILGIEEAGRFRPSLLCLPRSALIWIPPCPHCVQAFPNISWDLPGADTQMTSLSSWLLLSAPSPLQDVIFSLRLTCYHPSSLL